ncbi:carboxylesterase [Colletotrichum paranaense]|uniref:Carboxylesterase n=1 Tax=Colletotrichum paranaense TaxID=1914294 RepID=A0ABQ9SZE9_9PEZI|nr:carboxylesterase [Colletotrichum paranaense]KAK1544417.1 carboxylesterase [Colletotrichum paranaense]
MKHATLIIGVFCGLMAPKPTKFDTWSDVPDVFEYLGIPFAAAPVGALRFQPPVTYNDSAVINVSAFGPGCMQPPDTEYPQSEDCLSVNILTKPQVGERKKAVVGFPALSRNYMSTRWSRLGAAVGCGTDTSNATDPKLVTDCMRNRTSEKIFGAFGPEETGVGSTPAFGPGVDDILVFEDYTGR